MATLPDLLYVALFAAGMPLWDHLVYWPAIRRQAHTDPARARRRLWRGAIAGAWALVAVGAALWVANGRPWSSLGLAQPGGWRTWAAVGLVLLLAAYQGAAAASVARDPGARASVRRQVATISPFLPHTRSELHWFGGVSLTAGFCEEFLFRGYLIWALAPWLGWWGAAALSLAIFAAGHAYQGWNGVIRTGVAGAFFTLVVALLGSLWPAIALHALLDLGQGTIAWLALREGEQPTT